MSEQPKTTPVPDATRLAIERTYLAHERTLMAWIRTAVSLISFGFTIYKFFHYMRQLAPERFPEHALGVHLFATLMILVGLIALTLAWIQHRQQTRPLRQSAGELPYSLAGVVASFVAGLGIVALIAVSLHL